MDSADYHIITLINNLLVPLLSLVGAGGTLYCVLLGVKYAKAEEPQDREKAKSALKNAIRSSSRVFSGKDASGADDARSPARTAAIRRSA